MRLDTKSRRSLTVDLGFAVILGLFFIISNLLWTVDPVDVQKLFLASYILLGLGVLSFYLTLDMNPKFAYVIHLSFFPLSGGLFLFLRWVPAVIGEVEETILTFSVGVILYNFILVAYFAIDFYLHRREVRRETEEAIF